MGKEQNSIKHNNEQDINDAALSAGTTPERIQQGNVSQKQQNSADIRPTNMQDGYRANEGQEYEEDIPSQEQQEGYNATHSGVRHAANKPGTRVGTPGREGQPGWAEQLQMGRTTDTPQRKNPAD